MGRRGRQRAIEQKSARDLKYHSRDTDFDALQRELAPPGSGHGEFGGSDADDSDQETVRSADRW